MEFFILAIIATIILVAILVGVHEFGHLIVAKRLGVKVLRYSIGFGKRLVSFVSPSNIEYCISMFPLGGYVKMLDTREGQVTLEEKHLAFDMQVLWKRFLIIIAGPVFNFLFAMITLWVIFLIGYKSMIPIIPQIQADSPLAKAGVSTGVEVIAIDGYPTLDWADVTVRLFQRLGGTASIAMTIQSNHKQKTVLINMSQIQLDTVAPNPLKSIGIILTKENLSTTPKRVQQYHVIGAFGAAYQKLSMYSYFSVIVIKKLFMGTLSIKSLAGPIGLFAYAGLALMDSIMTFCLFMAIISIMIAVVNLLPFPGLDGGQLLYIMIEGVTGKPISIAVQVLLFRLGLILIGLLFVQIFVNDLLRFMS